MSLACLNKGSYRAPENIYQRTRGIFRQEKYRRFSGFGIPVKLQTVSHKYRHNVMTHILIDEEQQNQLEDLTPQYQQLCERLAHLIQLRKIYQHIIRAEYIMLVSPTPMYSTERLQQIFDKNQDQNQNLDSTLKISITDEQDKQQQLLRNTIEIISEMYEIQQQLQNEQRTLSNQLVGLFLKGEKEVSIVKERAQSTVQQLKDRIKTEFDSLPFGTLDEAKQWLLEGGESDDGEESYQQLDSNPLLQFEKVERSAEKFVARKLQPAVQKVRESQDMMDIFRDSAIYLKGLWIRLNGGGRHSSSNNSFFFEPLPQPQCSKSKIQEMIHLLEIESDDLEQRLQEANSAREQKLRNSGVSERTQLAFILRELDMEVMQVGRKLVLSSLQIMLQNIYLSLEEEIVEFDDKELAKQPVQSTYSDEVALYVAEFALLSEQISDIAPALNSQSGLILSQTDDQLEKLFQDINDMRNRLGISDRVVYGGSKLSLKKASLKIQLSTLESINKLKQGGTFLVRGVNLLGQDLGNAGGLFSKAAFGSNLKPREVMTLRRTFFDFLLFFPFIVILIVPITPVGHVLVFGFIQRFFPNLFPSQFSNRRQQIMVKYEQLRKQLEKAEKSSTSQVEDDINSDTQIWSDIETNSFQTSNLQNDRQQMFGADKIDLSNILQGINRRTSSSASNMTAKTDNNTRMID
eukprot:TRINITY_DN4856_c0_g1_i3.p1 TRINITY_DN4856_c0_g1~~TRINITY_DN4856_c0_g1_i3.p1  ORF type:complete len:689 (-),score=114.29 TRINITY_DN4856_c0_g1_i3:257-2323(-)